MKYVKIGYVAASFGVKGSFKVKPVTENPEMIGEAEFLLLSTDGKTVAKSLKILSVEPVKDCFLVKCEGIGSKDMSDALKNMSVMVPTDDLPDTGDDEVYWYMIEGAEVFDPAEHKIGILVDYIETGAHDVFRIKLDGGGYALISNNKTHVLSIDARERKIVIEPEGLVREDV